MAGLVYLKVGEWAWHAQGAPLHLMHNNYLNVVAPLARAISDWRCQPFEHLLLSILRGYKTRGCGALDTRSPHSLQEMQAVKTGDGARQKAIRNGCAEVVTQPPHAPEISTLTRSGKELCAETKDQHCRRSFF